MNCLHCGLSINLGRADRKFCCIDCKNKYHNSAKIREHVEIKKISGILKKNRRILKQLCAGEDEYLTNRREMQKLGFDFTFHTHHYRAHTKDYAFCFNYGYVILINDVVQIIRWPVKNSGGV